MNADEIVMALRCEHGHLTNHGRDFMLNYTREEFFKILNESADLLESLQADLRHEEKVSHGQMEQNKRLRKMMDKLQANLAESQHREQAAVKQIEQKMIFDAGMGCEPCEICSNADKTPCEECNPKWRGPQEAGEGEQA